MPDKAARGRVPAVRFVDQKPNLTKVRGIGPEPKNWLRVFSNAEASRFGQGGGQQRHTRVERSEKWWDSMAA